MKSKAQKREEAIARALVHRNRWAADPQIKTLSQLKHKLGIPQSNSELDALLTETLNRVKEAA